jgi:hypothetical protein
MSDKIRPWVHEQRKHYRNVIELIEKNEFFTGEVRNGQRIDTTAETLTHAKKCLAQIDEILTNRGG